MTTELFCSVTSSAKIGKKCHIIPVDILCKTVNLSVETRSSKFRNAVFHVTRMLFHEEFENFLGVLKTQLKVSCLENNLLCEIKLCKETRDLL